MGKKIAVGLFVLFLAVNIYGCIPIIVGAASAGGTAAWLSGKLTQEVKDSFGRSVEGARNALRSLKIDLEKETIKSDVAQFIGKYTDGRTVWVDVRPSGSGARIDVRVGMTGDKDAARTVLDKILRYL